MVDTHKTKPNQAAKGPPPAAPPEKAAAPAPQQAAPSAQTQAIARAQPRTVAVTDDDWIAQLGDAIKAGDSEKLNEALSVEDARVDVLGGDKIWVKPEIGTMLVGQLLHYDVRKREDDDGETSAQKDFVIRISSTKHSRVLSRGTNDPTGEDGHEVVPVTDADGTVKKYQLAQVGDIVCLSENANTGVLAERVGCLVMVFFRGKRSFKASDGTMRKVWDLQVFSKGKPKPFVPRQLGAGGEQIPF